MTIRPYKQLPLPHQEVAWWLDPEHILSEDGNVVNLDEALARKVQIWAPEEALRMAVQQQEGSAVLWNYVVIGWHPDQGADRWPVRGLKLDAPEDPRKCIEGLVKWRDWLEQYGASPRGSLGYTGLCLAKTFLYEDLWTSVGDLPPISYVTGGRQELVHPHPAIYEGNLNHCDIAAAYATVLGMVQYGGRWIESAPDPKFEKIAERNICPLIYVAAEVDIPDIPQLWHLAPENRAGPLMVRPEQRPTGVRQLFWEREADLYPSHDIIEGIWTIEELHAAEDAGCTVHWKRVWYHAASQQPFEGWYQAILKGRELGGFAASLAKATGNATWGQFAITKGDKLIYRGPKVQEKVPVAMGNPSQKAVDLAEYICGTVRAKLYRGMFEAGPSLITAHTDGLWTSGHPIKGWRVKETANEMRIGDAQMYAVREGDEEWRYCVSGALNPQETFETWWQENERIHRVLSAPDLTKFSA